VSCFYLGIRCRLNWIINLGVKGFNKDHEIAHVVQFVVKDGKDAFFLVAQEIEAHSWLTAKEVCYPLTLFYKSQRILWLRVSTKLKMGSNPVMACCCECELHSSKALLMRWSLVLTGLQCSMLCHNWCTI